MGMMTGIVGKPNVGKSTLFSAATLKSVPIANYPFTTIRANKGIGYVRVRCVCRELGVEDNPVNSACIDGNRFIPVELIDCAGLVPGAWHGRGLGNQFLDEVRRADSLIHVVDASGSTDIEGGGCPPGSHDPLEDVAFLEHEIDQWLKGILMKDWLKIARRVESTAEQLETLLSERLSGLSISREEIRYAVKEAGLNPRKPTAWKDDEILRFTSMVRKASKPMLIAANKMDLAPAEENIKRLEGSGYITVPCCAEAELALRRAAQAGLIEYLPGDDHFRIVKPERLTAAQGKALESIQNKILDKWGSTGIQDAINRAFIDLLGAIAVYPVQDPDKLTDHEGRVLPEAHLIPSGTTAKSFASYIHSELGEGFLYAVEVRSGSRVGEDYILKNGDVISIVSTKRRG
ncbi:MAG: redox-regulated ATPase YchF [Candidatus Bathyarchaeia archaeon]